MNQAELYKKYLKPRKTDDDGWMVAKPYRGKKFSSKKNVNVFDVLAMENIVEEKKESKVVEEVVEKVVEKPRGRWARASFLAMKNDLPATGAGDVPGVPVAPTDPIVSPPKVVKSKKKTLKEHVMDNTPITLTLNVRGKATKFSVCPHWASGDKAHMCPSFKCKYKLNHPYIRDRKTGKPLELRTCLSLVRRGFCDNDSCKYQHPPELVNKYSRFTNLCQAHHAKRLQDSGVKFDTICRGCSRPKGKCFHCHNQPQQPTEKMEEFLATDWSKVDIRILDREFDKLFQNNDTFVREWVSAHDFKVINVFDLTFEDKLNYWARISGWIGKIEKGRPVEKSLGYKPDSFKKWTLNLEEFGYDVEWLWVLYSRINVCKTHRIMLHKINSNTPLSIADVCVGGIYCKNGVHDPAERISIQNLMTGEVYDEEAIREERKQLKEQINDIKRRIEAGEYPEEKITKVTDKKSAKIISKFKGLKKTKAVVTQKTYPLAEKYQELAELENSYWISQPGICPTRFGYKSPVCYELEVEAKRTAGIKMDPLNGVVIERKPAVWETVPTAKLTPEERERLSKVKLICASIYKYIKKTEIVKKYDAVPREKIDFWHSNFSHMSFDKYLNMFEAREEEYERHLERLDEDDTQMRDVYLDIYGWIKKTPISSDKRVISNSILQKIIPLFMDVYIDSVYKKFETFNEYCKKQSWYGVFAEFLYKNPVLCVRNPNEFSRFIVSRENKYGLRFYEYLNETELGALWVKNTARFGISFEEFKKHPTKYNSYYSTTAHINETFEEYLQSSADGWMRPKLSKSGSSRKLNYWELPITTKFKKVYNPTLDALLITCSNNGKLCFIKSDEKNEIYESLIKSFKSKDDSLEEIYRECLSLGLKGIGMTQVNEFLFKKTIKEPKSKSVFVSAKKKSSSTNSKKKGKSMVGVVLDESDDEDEFGFDIMNPTGGNFDPEFSDKLKISEIKLKGKSVTNITGFSWSKKKADDLKILVSGIRKLGVSSKLIRFKKENMCDINIYTYVTEPKKQQMIVDMIRSIIGGEIDFPTSWSIRVEEDAIDVEL